MHSPLEIAQYTVYDSDDTDAKEGVEALDEAHGQVDQIRRRLAVSVDHANKYLGVLG